jgi:hypothetical protein
MGLLRYLRDGAWTPVAGYLPYVPLLAAGTTTTARSSSPAH